jgi:hypothetical protein
MFVAASARACALDAQPRTHSRPSLNAHPPAAKPCAQATDKVLGRVRVAVEDVAKEGRIKDSWPLLEAQVGGGAGQPASAADAGMGAPAGCSVAGSTAFLPFGAGLSSQSPPTLPCPSSTASNCPGVCSPPPSAPQTGDVHMALEWNPVVVDQGESPPTTRR